MGAVKRRAIKTLVTKFTSVSEQTRTEALCVINLKRLGADEKKQLVDRILSAVEEDNEKFLQTLRSRADRYEHLAVEGDVHVGSRALPTLINATLNSIESVLGLFRLTPSKKRKIQILKDANRIDHTAFGSTWCRKTTFLLSLAGKLDVHLRRTCAYISQHDLHHGEMTVREILDFSGRCLGVGQLYELLAELSRREKEAGIKPDPEIDTFMKATSISGQKNQFGHGLCSQDTWFGCMFGYYGWR